uniref:30S ribosomal protein S6, chloroplastic n=1 Tax=Harveyella mirabilis TaxID=282355 RepID=A0A3S8UW38_9FLOR|nr:ribosomal protein S6 [Harveyella mirabilis]
MFLNNYETICILRPDLLDHMNLSLVNYYKSLLKEKFATNIFVQHRGKRHLSYEINCYNEGIYLQMNYQASGEVIDFLEQSIRLNDNILRYLIIKQNMIKSITIY